jgi:hypothetical protein
LSPKLYYLRLFVSLFMFLIEFSYFFHPLWNSVLSYFILTKNVQSCFVVGSTYFRSVPGLTIFILMIFFRYSTSVGDTRKFVSSHPCNSHWPTLHNNLYISQPMRCCEQGFILLLQVIDSYPSVGTIVKHDVWTIIRAWYFCEMQAQICVKLIFVAIQHYPCTIRSLLYFIPYSW